MPELPEVETVKRTLAPMVTGKKITGVKVYHTDVVAVPEPGSFERTLTGRCIERIERRGKYLVFRLAGRYCLVVHLRMTGRLFLTEKVEPVALHTHAVISLEGGRYLHWVDSRRFGRFYLVKEEDITVIRGLSRLGPEPLDPSFGLQDLAAICGKSRRPLKQVLLDQDAIAGIGNIYADEILHCCGLRPDRPAASLDAGDIDALYRAVVAVLNRAITNQGTSIRDYVDGIGRRGSNQNYLQVYGRTGRSCYRCGKEVERIKIGGRSTHFCPGCQK